MNRTKIIPPMTTTSSTSSTSISSHTTRHSDVTSHHTHHPNRPHTVKTHVACLLALLVVGRVLRCFVCVCVASHFWRLQTTLLHVAPLSHFPDFLRWVGSKWLICWCRCRLARCTNCRKLFESPVHVQLSIVSSQQFFFFFFSFLLALFADKQAALDC